MNILFISDLYPVNNSDRTSFALKNICESFRNSGHSVQVVRPNFLLNSIVRGKKFFKTGQYENLYNINYFTPFLFNFENKLPKLEDFEIIVSHMPSGSIFAGKLAKNQGKDLICGIHNSDLKVLTQKLYSVYFKTELINAFKYAKKLVCRSYVIQKKLLELYPEFEAKTVVVPVGLDINDVNMRDVEFNEPLKVLTCGNLIKRKNLDKVIEALKDFDGVELTVIGDGKEFERLKKISKNVDFKGSLSKEKVLEYMSKSDVFILPSVDETLGMVYLEAMSQGCITVGTLNEGVDGVIKNGENGFLIEPTVKAVKNVVLKIKSLDKSDLEKISQNCYNSLKPCLYQTCSDKYFS